MKFNNILLIAFGIVLIPLAIAMQYEIEVSVPVAALFASVFIILLIWGVWVAHKEVIGKSELGRIDELYRHFKTEPDFAFELVMLYEAGANKEFFDKHPEQAKKVFEAALYWLDLVETNQVDESKKPELEDYYYVGLMYEEGFSVVPNLEQAIEYYKKALATSACWDGSPQHYKQLRKQVEDRLANLTQAQ